MYKKIKILFDNYAFALIFVIGVFALPELAYAQTTTGSSGGADSLGGMMAQIVKGINKFPSFVVAACFIAATYITITAVFKTVDHVKDPNQTPLIDPLKRIIIAGAFFALPTVLKAVADLMAGQSLGGLSLGGGAGRDGLDGAIASFVKDVASNGTKLVNAFSYVAAIIITAFAVSRLLRSTQEGPKGPTGFGTWMMFLVASALFSLPSLMNAFQGTLFGGGLQGYSVLANRDNIGLTPGEAARVNNVTNAVIGFLFFLGWISFVRGIFIIRDVSDGGGQASLMAGVTHMVGGGLAVNVGSFMQAVEKTLGL